MNAPCKPWSLNLRGSSVCTCPTLAMSTHLGLGPGLKRQRALSHWSLTTGPWDFGQRKSIL